MNLPTPTTRIAALQARLRQAEVAAWIVPTADPHQSEYVAEHWQERAWLSGFSGSAGTLVVTQTGAGLWTDPRYHLRGESELAGSGIVLHRAGLAGVPSYAEWLAENLNDGDRLGFNAERMSIAEIERLQRAFGLQKVEIYTRFDLAGSLWTDRPPLPADPLRLYDERFAGESRREKLARIRAEMAQAGVDGYLLTALDEIAWTFNIRGSDVAYNPVAIAYAFISLHEIHLFVHPGKVDPTSRAALAGDGVSLLDYTAIAPFWNGLPSNSRVFIDPTKTSYHFLATKPDGCHLHRAQSIAARLKAVKNAREAEGFRSAHLRDGVAMVRWLIWLEEAVPTESHTEITLGEKLAELRSQGEHYRGESFGTITGYGPNSAVGHYSPRPETTPTVRPAGLLLSDSGGQYEDGTTDITRTIALGPPSDEARRVFTTVLKCHIRLATTRFPQGTTGSQLDALAREFLWREGWNCRHGIGHGVGHFLNVHEGPQRFSTDNRVALQPGMVTSNEPGVYFTGKFGVRLENLLLCVADSTTDFGDFYRFETLGLCPFDLSLVDASRLDETERDWLNDYHQRVYDSLAPLLNPAERVWLYKATRRI
jgi:Xaa-Pro aminopeptidase